MGTLVTYNFEGTQGATIAGSGIALQGAGQAVYDSAEAVVGGTGGKTSATAGSSRYALCTITVPSLTMALSPYIRTPTTTPTVDYTMFTVRHASGVLLRVIYTPAGAVGVQGVSGGFHSMATGVALNLRIRWELLLVVATATTGTITAKAYTGSSWTTQLGSTYTSTTFDMGTAPVAAFGVGSVTADTPGGVIGFDYVRAEDGRTTEFGPPPAVSGPTANAGPDQYVAQGTVVTLTGAASTAGSGTLTYQWGPVSEIPPGAASPSLSAPTGQTTTFTATTAGRYTFPLTVTQTGGLTSVDSVTVWVYPPSNSAVRAYDVLTTTATNEGGATSYENAVNDASDSTYLLTPLDPVVGVDVIPVIAEPFGPGTVAWSDDAYYQGAPCTMRVRIYKQDGTTVIGDTTHTLTTTKATYVTDADETLIPLLSDRRALVIKHDFAVI